MVPLMIPSVTPALAVPWVPGRDIRQPATIAGPSFTSISATQYAHQARKRWLGRQRLKKDLINAAAMELRSSPPAAWRRSAGPPRCALPPPRWRRRIAAAGRSAARTARRLEGHESEMACAAREQARPRQPTEKQP